MVRQGGIMQNEEQYQISLLGTAGVGKSSLVLRYTKNEFNPIYIPNLVDNVHYRYQIKGRAGV